MSRWLSLPLLAACSLTPTDPTPSTYASFERVISTADACVDPNLFLWAGQRGDRQNVTLYVTDGLAQDACAAAEAHLRAGGYTFGRLEAQWKGEPATERQINALRKWRIRRDLSTISRGEASALLDAVTSRQRVARAIREGALVPAPGPRPDPATSREPDAF